MSSHGTIPAGNKGFAPRSRRPAIIGAAAITITHTVVEEDEILPGIDLFSAQPQAKISEKVIQEDKLTPKQPPSQYMPKHLSMGAIGDKAWEKAINNNGRYIQPKR